MIWRTWRVAQVHDRDLEAALDARGVGDLAVLLRGVPGGRVVPVADGGQPAHVQPLAVHHVDLRRAAAVGREGDLLARGAPEGRGVEAGDVGHPARAAAVGVRHPDVAVARPVAGVRDALAVRAEGGGEGLAARRPVTFELFPSKIEAT